MRKDVAAVVMVVLGACQAVRLTFEKSAPLDVTAKVLGIGATAPGSPDMPGMKMN